MSQRQAEGVHPGEGVEGTISVLEDAPRTFYVLALFSQAWVLSLLPLFLLEFIQCLLIVRAFLIAPATGTVFHLTCHPRLFLGHS